MGLDGGCLLARAMGAFSLLEKWGDDDVGQEASSGHAMMFGREGS